MIRKRQPLPLIDPITAAVSAAARLTPAQRDELTRPTMRAAADLARGVSPREAWLILADALNIAEALADAGIAPDHRASIDAGQIALYTVQQRHAERGSWTLRGPEICAIDAAVGLYAIQLDYCSQRELREAVQRTQRRVRGALQRGQGVRV